jgi:hypothetical protein
MSKTSSSARDPLTASAVSRERIEANAAIANRIKTFGCLVGGACCGMLGLTGFMGLLFFFASYALSCVVAGGSHAQRSIWTDGWGQPLMSFVVLWTLFYDIVYIF